MKQLTLLLVISILVFSGYSALAIDNQIYTQTEKDKLANVEPGAEVNTISDANATDLTDAGDSTLHHHASDRARANHTGTQTASTISDFVTTTQSIKLDDFATPDDNTDLNATSTYHGLLTKLSNVSTEFLNGTGVFSTPVGGGGAVDSVNGETGIVIVDLLKTPNGLTNVVVVDSAGDVGFGESNPIHDIHVSDSDVKIRLNDTDAIAYHWDIENYNGVYRWQLANSEVARFSISKNMGIGGIDPDNQLHVYDSGENTVLKLESGDGDVGMLFEDNTGITTLTHENNGYFLINPYTGSYEHRFSQSAYFPSTTNVMDLGTSSLGFKDGFFTGDVIIGGNIDGRDVSVDGAKLDGIAAGAEANNISDVNATDLTDAGDSTLHYNATDRARANHTGTQTVATISDFDTEVESNTGVTANTAKASYPGSADSTELNILDGATLTTTELNYVDGVTSDIQTQLNSKTDDIVDDTTPQLGGSLDLNEKSLTYEFGALTTDHTYSGDTISATAGEALAIGDVCYYKSDGKFWLADADAEATTKGLIALATATISADATGVFLIRGLIRDDTWTWTTADTLWVPLTPGNPTATEPTVSGDFARLIGYAQGADYVWFGPSQTYEAK